MTGSTMMLIEAALPLGPVGLLVVGAAFLWVVGFAIHARPRQARSVPVFRLASRKR